MPPNSNMPMAGHPLFANGPYPSQEQLLGMLHTRTWANHTTKFKPSFAQEALKRYPSGNIKLFPLIDMLDSGTVSSVDYGYTIKNMSFPSLLVKTKIPAATGRQTTQINVHSTNGIIPNMLFTAVPFGEQMMVLSVLGENHMVVMRGLGSVAPYEIPEGTQLSFSGTVFEEGSLRPLTRASAETKLFVHSQIFRDSWALTDTARVIATAHGENVYADNKSDAMFNHSWAIEMAMMLGQKSATVYQGKPMRTMSGLREFITANAPQNVWAITKGLQYEELNYIFDSFGEVQIGKNPSSKRIIFADRTFVNAISQMGRKYGYTVNVTNGQDSFGQRFRSFMTERLEFQVYEHPLLNLPQVQGNVRGVGIVLDPGTLSLKYLPQRKQRVTHFNTNASGSTFNETENDEGIDAVGGTITSELMLLCSNPAANGMIFGLEKGVCNDC